ncbi:MAG: phosphoribosyl-ATP diphosphatase [Alphaproteobacteria bacterium]|nr:phosphoribosyl-ATP diphosphatase [Alphaproteobacteria bacterium]
MDILAELLATIEARKAASPDESYTAQLLAEPSLAFKKLGEEATETIIAGLGQDRAALAQEAADLLYHLLVALAARDVAWADVLAVLKARQGQSGLAEKAARKK